MTQIITSNSWWGGGWAWAYTYKWTVNTYEDLPSTWLKIWDVYNVINEHTTDPKFPAWANVAWTGTEWDVLGWTFDLSSYQKKLVEWTGIDIDQDTNEISVDTTVIATKQDLSTKQDTISDLDTIRSNASAGKTAKDTIDTYWNIVTHNVSEFATSAQGAKADTALQPNDNVSELSNDAGYIDKDVNNLTNYTKTSDLPDFTTYQLKSNMVTSLNSADDNHYPTAKAVKDAITWAWGWDVSWPSSSVDGHLAVFDWATGKIIKDWWAIPTPTTVVDNLNSTSVTSALSANQGNVLKWYVDTINGKIPSEASSSNQLADKNYVDDSINQVAAYYITRTAAWDAFATKAQLLATTTFYSWWTVRTPTRNDYCIVLADETHNWETTRYSYQWSSWEYQYTVNETALTQQQVDALNSWITSTKVWQYDTAVSTISWYGNIVTHNTSEFATATQGWKADTALQPNDNISELNNDAWYITWVNWGSVGWTLSNQVDLQNALNAKANDSAVVHNTWAETIAWTKTFSTSPVVPSKTTAAWNNATTIATEAQVYKKQDTLVSWTNIKTVNSTSLLGSGNIAVQPTLVSWTNIKTINSTSLLGSGNIAINQVPSSWTTWYVLTKTSNWYWWAAPTGWISLDANSPITVSKLRVGTEAQYSALGSYSNDTVYLTV